MIRFTTDSIEMPALDERKLNRWIRAVAADYGFTVGNINYIFCSDERELAVNREFLGHDYYTDVITFDYSTASTLNGDIFISLDTVRTNAEKFNHPHPRRAPSDRSRRQNARNQGPDDRQRRARFSQMVVKNIFFRPKLA